MNITLCSTQWTSHNMYVACMWQEIEYFAVRGPRSHFTVPGPMPHFSGMLFQISR